MLFGMIADQSETAESLPAPLTDSCMPHELTDTQSVFLESHHIQMGSPISPLSEIIHSFLTARGLASSVCTQSASPPALAPCPALSLALHRALTAAHFRAENGKNAVIPWESKESV